VDSGGKMKVAVIGLDHLGMVTAASLASKGHTVSAIDKNPIFDYSKEQGLQDLIKFGLENYNLHIYKEFPKLKVDIVWITYDTPVELDNESDVEFIIEKIQEVLRNFPHEIPIIISSQLPVGTVKFLESKYIDCCFSYVPENLRHGTAINNFLNPDRIIWGCRNKAINEKVRQLLDDITSEVFVVETESAEMIKHSINGFLATEITFANELGRICEKFNIDYGEVLIGLRTDKRIGNKGPLKTGKAYSNKTLERDVRILINLAPTDMGLFQHIEQINNWRLEQEKKNVKT
jgi:UDPglucose 6-dehydrogenase